MTVPADSSAGGSAANVAVVDEAECIDCGTCTGDCPTEAITV